MCKNERSISVNWVREICTEMGESNVLLRDIHSRDTKKILGVSIEWDEMARRLENLYHRARWEFKKKEKIIIHILSRWLRVKGYEISKKLRVGWHAEWFPLQGFSCTSYSLIVFKVWASEYKTHFLQSVVCKPWVWNLFHRRKNRPQSCVKW